MIHVRVIHTFDEAAIGVGVGADADADADTAAFVAVVTDADLKPISAPTTMRVPAPLAIVHAGALVVVYDSATFSVRSNASSTSANAIVLTSHALSAAVVAFAAGSVDIASGIASDIAAEIGAGSGEFRHVVLAGSFGAPGGKLDVGDVAALPPQPALVSALLTPLGAVDAFRTFRPLERAYSHTTRGVPWRGDVIAVAPAAWLYSGCSMHDVAFDKRSSTFSARLHLGGGAKPSAARATRATRETRETETKSANPARAKPASKVPHNATPVTPATPATPATPVTPATPAVADAILAPHLSHSMFVDAHAALATRVVLACTAAIKGVVVDAHVLTPLVRRFQNDFVAFGTVPAFVHAARAKRLRALWLRARERETK